MALQVMGIQAVAKGVNSFVRDIQSMNNAIDSAGKSYINVGKDIQKFAQASIKGNEEAAKVAGELAKKYELIAQRATSLATKAAARGDLAKAAGFADTARQAENLADRYRKLEEQSRALGRAHFDLGKVTKFVQENWAALSAASATLIGGLYSIKKAFDFGREGALIEQTGESFAFLIQKIGAAPDLLNQLRVASKGTIDDLSLMSSTATLLAGAGDNLALALANATPRLLEIAKAANKLNPSLGTTSFMYESISTGIKRASPLILDNLGITVKVGEATEKFAESIGKSVDELTTEERAMALLSATLEAGDNLIQQVGGSTDSATDSFDRMTVALKQVADEGKKKFSPFIERAAEALTLLLTAHEKIEQALIDHEIEIRNTSATYEEYRNEIARVNAQTGAAVGQIEYATEAEWRQAKALADAAPQIAYYASQLGTTGTNAGTAAEAVRSITVALGELTEAEYAREAMQALDQAFKDGKISADDYRNEYIQVATKLGNMDHTAVHARLTLFDLQQQLAQGQISAQDFAQAMIDIGDEGLPAVEETPTLSGKFFQELEDANLQANAVAVEAGDTSAWAAAIDQSRKFGDNVWTAYTDIKKAQEKLAAIPEHKTITIDVKLIGDLGIPGFQHGGSFQVGGRPGADQNLVAFRASRGEVVSVTPSTINNSSNRSVNMGDVNIGRDMSFEQFDANMQRWLGA